MTEFAINQSPPQVVAAYRPGGPFEKRRSLMEAWARHFSQLTSGVVPIRFAPAVRA